MVGFYDTLSHRLVYSGTTHPSPYQRYVLSHELTHALDDQRFDLSREDALAYRCADEPLAASIALAEGDAVYTSGAWARRFLSSDEIDRCSRRRRTSRRPPRRIPPFVQALQVFPYPNGLAFVRALVDPGRRGSRGRRLPQPARVHRADPASREVPVRRPDPGHGREAGGPRREWTLIDQMEVGEAWLRLMLQLKMPDSQAAVAAAGWGGAEYETWTDGTSTVVVLNTTWDTARDAQEFETALRSYADAAPVRITRSGSDVTATFASDPAALAAASG